MSLHETLGFGRKLGFGDFLATLRLRSLGFLRLRLRPGFSCGRVRLFRDFRPRILERHHSIEDGGAVFRVRIGIEVAEAFELETVAGTRAGETRLDLGAK